MKHQWQIQRTVKESVDGQKRWDQAYRLLLTISQSVEQHQEKPAVEVNHASSNVCPRIDPTPGTSANH
jgi:sulfur transfer protein SufE